MDKIAWIFWSDIHSKLCVGSPKMIDFLPEGVEETLFKAKACHGIQECHDFSIAMMLRTAKLNSKDNVAHLEVYQGNVPTTYNELYGAVDILPDCNKPFLKLSRSILLFFPQLQLSQVNKIPALNSSLCQDTLKVAIN
ncbi:unnamed protein product [Lepeophtheirus salmonis]|uniref:(salmon louse) hypothetical protein n=1 Tax=Lepeophtheirus salmonis TaxID=72036 RepID=A0A7R8CP99_LEPSM|nr:unnamed protein product [Lepeophtheirus salmonis]CAF2884202.1 unnamed protein product [Lepeophtheirus salmonis]